MKKFPRLTLGIPDIGKEQTIANSHGQRKIYMDSARYTIPKYKAKAEANASNLKACISVPNLVKVRLSAAQKEES